MNRRARVCVFAPAPLVTVTIERVGDGREDLHLHPGGQGYWVARMVATLGGSPVLCLPLGGETGRVARVLLAEAEVDVREVATTAPTGAYVHDRRGGGRAELWRAHLQPLGRHELDELFNATLIEALDAGKCVLTGTGEQESVVPLDVYERLTSDLAANGVATVADLRGGLLRAALAGGVELVKISHAELVDDGWARGDDPEELASGMRELLAAGARNLVVSQAEGGALACLEGRWLAARGPRMAAADPAGAGDSMTAALAFGLATGIEPAELLRLAVAAGSVNVTRHGLGSGDADAIRRLAANVQVEPLQAAVA